MIVADTHAWLWWISGDAALSSAAKEVLAGALDDGQLGVSAISVWEAAILAKKGRLELALEIPELVRHCETLPGFRFLAVTPHIAMASVAIEPFHADPADRLIAATAFAHRAALVTKDTRLRALDGLVSLW